MSHIWIRMAAHTPHTHVHMAASWMRQCHNGYEYKTTVTGNFPPPSGYTHGGKPANQHPKYRALKPDILSSISQPPNHGVTQGSDMPLESQRGCLNRTPTRSPRFSHRKEAQTQQMQRYFFTSLSVNRMRSENSTYGPSPKLCLS